MEGAEKEREGNNQPLTSACYHGNGAASASRHSAGNEDGGPKLRARGGNGGGSLQDE